MPSEDTAMSEKPVIDGTFTEIETTPDPIYRKGGKNEAPVVYLRPPPEVEDRLWEQWPFETGKAYRAFLIYRDLGVDRRLSVVATTLHNEFPGTKASEKWNAARNHYPMYLRNWRRDYLWDIRVRAWDAFVFKEQEMAWRRRQEDLREKQWSSSENLFKLALDALSNLQPGDLTPKEIARFLDLASKLGTETRQGEITADYLKMFLDAFPEQLRNEIVKVLKQ